MIVYLFVLSIHAASYDIKLWYSDIASVGHFLKMWFQADEKSITYDVHCYSKWYFFDDVKWNRVDLPWNFFTILRTTVIVWLANQSMLMIVAIYRTRISTYINTKMCVCVFVCLCVCSRFSRPFGILLGYPLVQSCLMLPKWF